MHAATPVIDGRGSKAMPSSTLLGLLFTTWMMVLLPSPLIAGEPRIFTVAQQGPADFSTVQAAINAAASVDEPVTLRLKAGTYREVVDVPAHAPPIRLVGEGATTTRIVFDHYAALANPATGKPFGTFGSATVFVRSNDFSAEHLTFANDAGKVGQAVAVAIIGTRAAFRSVRFLGNQDTLYLQGHDSLAYFRDCYIEGTVDFIFGAGTALFERCQIHSLGDGYVTAAATPITQSFGYVFRNCRLTAAPEVSKVYLGRPWRPYARVAFVDSEIGGHILAEGWHDWGKPERQATVDYAEFGNAGPGASTGRRVPWSRLLTSEQASKLDRNYILGAWRPFE